MAMVTKEENPVTVAAAANVNLPQTLSPESAAPVSHTDREVNTNTTPIALEKPSEDGFNWRKYGQKNVKGNEYVRSYYKCSYPNCSVKKQIERSHDGRITDVTYLGSHEHAKPISEPKGVSVPLLRPHCPPSAAIANEDKTSDKFGADDVQPMNVEITTVTVPDDPTPMPVTPLNQRRDEHNESLTPKRRKKTADVTDITPEKPGQESRLVIQTVSEVDIVNDGYRWRKYGQKMVKGNPNPRSYYRCSTAGCPVKKHVERASYDPKVVITTYEGQHDHNLPPVRTILPQSPSAPSSGGVEPNGAEKSKSEESDDARHPTVEEKDAPSVTVEGDSEKLSSDDNSDRMTEETERVQVETKVEVSKTEPKEAEAEADSGRLTKSEISKTEPKDVKPEIPKTDPKDGATDSTVSLTKPEISTTEPTDMETEISTTPEPKDVKTEISTTPEPKDGATTDSGSLTKPEISKTEPTDMDTENVVTEISKTPEAKDVKTEISETDPKDNATDETDPNTVVEKTAEEPGKC